MSTFKEQLEKAKEEARVNNKPLWMRIIKRHWKQLNELYMLVIMLVAWITFPTWIRVLYALFYPKADVQIGVTDPGFFQNIILGLLVFYAAGMAAWWLIIFSFPKAGHWLDNLLDHKAFTERAFSATDRYRAKLIISLYLVLFGIAAWCIIAMMPGFV